MEVLFVADRDFMPQPGSEQHKGLLGWLAEHDVDANVTHRVEIHVDTVPILRVFAFALNEDGKKFSRPGADGEPEVAMEPPRDVPLRSRPPVRFCVEE